MILVRERCSPQQADEYSQRFDAFDVLHLVKGGITQQQADQYSQRFSGADIAFLFRSGITQQQVDEYSQRFSVKDVMSLVKGGCPPEKADEYNQRFNNIRADINSYILHHKNFNRFDNNPINIVRVTWKEHHDIHAKKAKEIWENSTEEMRERHKNNIMKALSDPKVRKKLSEKSKKYWNNPIYRAKFPPEHFEKMLKSLWEKSGIKEFHGKKIAQQRLDEKFRKKQ